MDGQGNLFGHNAYGDIEAKKLARTDGPIESKIAAQDVVETIGEKQAFAIQCVKDHPGKTAMELASLYQTKDSREIGRRLPECIKMGLVKKGESRRCTVTNKTAATWLPITSTEKDHAGTIEESR